MHPDDPRHGTSAGYCAHIAAKIQPCQPCRAAHAKTVRHWRYASELGRETSVAAFRVHRRIQALSALGWTFKQIENAAGYRSEGDVQSILKSSFCHIRTFKRIDKVYQKLSMTLPPPGPWTTRRRNSARANGYLPPLAWDNIDDPNEHPNLLQDHFPGPEAIDHAVIHRILTGDWNLPANNLERAQVCAQYIRNGGTANELERLTGWNIQRYYRVNAA